MPAIEASLYLDGIGFGLTMIPTIILSGEIASKNNRGILFVIPMTVNAGIFIQALYTQLWYVGYNSFTYLQMQGTLSIVFGVMALFTTLTILESPIYFLKRNNETEAIRHIKLLRRYVNLNKEVKQTLEENKALIEDDASRTLNQNLLSGVPAFVKLGLLHGVSTLTFCYPMTIIFYYVNTYNINNLLLISWTPYVFVLFKWLGSFFGVIFSANKRVGITVGFGACSVFMFIIGGLLEDPSAAIDSDVFTSILSLMLAMQFFAGLIEPLLIVYLSEAFSLQVKAFYISSVNIIGYLVQIFCLAVILNTVGSYGMNAPVFAFIAAALELVMALLAIFTLAQTQNQPLVRCREMLSKWPW